MQVINRIKTRIYRIVAIAFLVRKVSKPKTFFIQRQTNIAANAIFVRRPLRISRHHLRDKPLFNFMSGRALPPRIYKRIHTSREPIHKRILNHAKHMARAGLEFRQVSILVNSRNSCIFTSTVNITKVHINAIVIRFAGPIQNQRRNLEGRANAENSRITRGIARHVTTLRIRINPDRIVQRHQRIQRNQGIKNFRFRNITLAAIAFHTETLLKINLPVIRMLVNGAGVPATRIRKRTHLDHIICGFHNHRRGHIFPRTLQAHHLRFRRIERNIESSQRSGRIQPSLVNTRWEKIACTRPRIFSKIRMWRPIVAATQNLHRRHRRIPLSRRHESIFKIDMTPVLVFTLRAEACRRIQNVIVYLDIESAVAISRIRAPRMVNMQTTRRVKALARSPNFIRNLWVFNRSIHKKRILRIKDAYKIDYRILISRKHIPRSLVTHKITSQQRVIRNHRWR